METGQTQKIYSATDEAASESSLEIVMIESKIGSWEGVDQLKRYAGHLQRMYGDRKTLVYITRNYDPKDAEEIEAETSGIEFRQLRWHDLHKFLQHSEKDALTEEVMLFMEEQGMSRSHRFSTSDLVTLSGVPRAFELLHETIDQEITGELERFAGNKSRRPSIENDLPGGGRYIARAPLYGKQQGKQAFCAVGYRMPSPQEHPIMRVALVSPSDDQHKAHSISIIRSIAQLEEWQGHVDNPNHWDSVDREMSIVSILSEEDHIAAVKRFFIESIRQLREELTEFKKENPELPWSGGS